MQSGVLLYPGFERVFAMLTHERENNRKKAVLLIALIVVAVIWISEVKVRITGNAEGAYLLHGTDGYAIEIRDDLYLNESQRYIVGIDFSRIRQYLFVLSME